jgi:ELWxxDGT repeat protein
MTDGSPADTTLLKDINGGTAESVPGKAYGVNGKVVFATAGTAGLWAFPDDAAGAAPQRLSVGEGGPLIGIAANLTPAGDRLYFTATVTGVTGTPLCVTDGSPAGTRIVNALSGITNPSNFYAIGARLYFTGGSFNAGTLYTSDGTDAGTIPLAGGGVLTFSPAGATLDSRGFVAFQDKLYFAARQSTGTMQLWKSDGTPSGTTPVTNFTFDPGNDSVSWLTPLGDRLYFLAGQGNLYQTDGTPEGTSVLPAAGTTTRLEIVGDRLLLAQSPGITRFTPGDPAPTPLLDWNFEGKTAVRIGKLFYFQATRSSDGPLWRTDGTPEGTVMLTQIGFGPTDLTAVGDALYFINTDLAAGKELWTSDGTPAGTYLVADIIPGRDTSSPSNLSQANGTLYFSANDGIHGRELWRAIDDVAPAAVSTRFDYSAHPPAITVTFNKNVAGTLSLADWKLTDRATGQDVSGLLGSMSFDPNFDTATLVLPPALSDGDYRLTLPAAAVADRAGNPSTAELAFDFFQLAADINHDRAVDFADLVILAQNYNTTGKTWSTGDLTGDGAVDFSDLVLLAQRYNTSLSPPPPAAPAIPTNAPTRAFSTASQVPPPPRARRPAVPR